MGVDVYLKWDGQTKKEKDAQITGFDIGMGHVGYLRAAYGMGPELDVLKKVFPNWDYKGNIDFQKEIPGIIPILRRYLTETKDNNDYMWAIIWANSLVRFFQLGCEKQDKGKNPRVYISY